MPRSPDLRGFIITGVIALAAGVATYVVVRSDPFAVRRNTLNTLDLSSLYEVDPSLVEYEQVAELRIPLEAAVALAVGPKDNTYVAGDRAVKVLGVGGAEVGSIATEGQPSCLAIGGDEHATPGRVYVGAGKRIELFGPDGAPAGTWDIPGANVILTSIALAKDNVFVADAGNRVVLRYDLSGNILGKIGASDESGEGRSFNIPSSYFDIAVSSEGLVHVANPGVLRIESYTADGQMEVRWGEAGGRIDDFFGCCNPSQFAVLPSGEIVTSEKGVPRVKVYSEYGEFACVVAGPQHLGVAQSELGDPRAVHAKAIFDVATDSRGRVLVLDPRKMAVRVFSRKSDKRAETGELAPPAPTVEARR